MLEKYKEPLNCRNVVFLGTCRGYINIHPAKIHPPLGLYPNPLCCVYVTCVSMRQQELLSNMFSQIKGMCLKCWWKIKIDIDFLSRPVCLPVWKAFQFTVANIHEILEPSLETKAHKKDKQDSSSNLLNVISWFTNE